MSMNSYNFYGWETADVTPIVDCGLLVKNPRDLYDQLSEIWCADTCAPRMRDKWSKENKTKGQCSITAFLVQDIFGGTVYGIPLKDGSVHCYNVIGDCVFDLTSEQFGEEARKLVYEKNPEQFREQHFEKEEKRLRYEYLRKAFLERCNIKSWKTLDSRYVLDTRWLKVRKDVAELPNGIVLDDYYVIEQNNVALVVAINERNELLLKREYRYPIHKSLLELPGGTFERNEKNPLDVAKRELLEETGYASEEWELLSCNYDFPTKEVGRVYLYLAKNIRKIAKQQLDISEDIELELVPLEQAVAMCMNNEIAVNSTMAGVLKAARILEKNN